MNFLLTYRTIMQHQQMSRILFFRKRRSCVGTYDELVFGNKADAAKYKVKIKDYIANDFIE